jgi:hypothetical protein
MRKIILTAIITSLSIAGGNAIAGGSFFTDVHRGGTARFDGTRITCTLPKATNVGPRCDFRWSRWRNPYRPTSVKWSVEMFSTGVTVDRFSSNGTLRWSRFISDKYH